MFLRIFSTTTTVSSFITVGHWQNGILSHTFTHPKNFAQQKIT